MAGHIFFKTATLTHEKLFNGRVWMAQYGWRSGESTRLLPMWPGFDFRARRHMGVEFDD